jgi:choline-sulfatase
VLRNQTGIAQGFESYDDAVEIEGGIESLGALQRDGAVAVASLLKWIEGVGSSRFFAFLHLYEPHSPYKPPEGFRNFSQPYDGEVAYADALVGRFLDGLRSRGLYDRAIVVVTADHGEGLKDHREAEHGIFLYREVVHVPLLIRLPRGARGGTRIAGTVAQVDIAATLLDLAGLPRDGIDGVSFKGALETGSLTPRPVYSETLFPRYHYGWSDLYAVTEARYRYIRAPHAELYDLEGDPSEATNLMPSRASTAAAMNAWLEKVGTGNVTAPQEVSAETREKLQALGYIGGGGTSVAQGDLPDPKDKIESYEELKRALALRQEGKDAEAIEGFRKVLAENPRMMDAWETLGTTLLRTGRTKEGIAALGEVLKIEPGHVSTHIALVKTYAMEGKRELAMKHAEIAAVKNPGEGYETLAQLMLDVKDPGRASEFARRSIAADPERAMSHFVLGVVAQRQGQYEAAVASFRRAEEAKKRRKHAVIRNLHANMGDCLARLGRIEEAEQEFLTEIKTLPQSREGRTGLAMLYRALGRNEDARAVLAGLAAAEPRPTADTYWTIVQTLNVLGDQPAAREWALKGRTAFPADPRFRQAMSSEGAIHSRPKRPGG